MGRGYLVTVTGLCGNYSICVAVTGSYVRGGSRIFMGVQKIMGAHIHITSVKPEVPMGRGLGPALGPWKLSGVFDALSCYLSLISKYSDTKWDKKPHSRSNFSGARHLCAPPPLNPPLYMWRLLEGCHVHPVTATYIP